MIDKITNHIGRFDEIVPPSSTLLHYNAEIRQKTCLAGFISLCIIAQMTYMVIYNGLEMVNWEDADIVATEVAFDIEETPWAYFTDRVYPIPLTIFMITDQNPDTTIELDYESRKYIIVRL